MNALRLRVLLLVLLAVAWPMRAFAQEYPTQPVKMVVGFAAGGPTDIIGRLFAQKMGELLGKPMVVENKPGAGGNVAAERSPASALDAMGQGETSPQTGASRIRAPMASAIRPRCPRPPHAVAALLRSLWLLALLVLAAPVWAQRSSSVPPPPHPPEKPRDCSVDCKAQLIPIYKGMNNIERDLDRKLDASAFEERMKTKVDAIAIDRSLRGKADRAELTDKADKLYVDDKIVGEGSFIGVWLAGYLYDTTSSYAGAFYISIGLGVFAAIVNLPVNETPLASRKAAPAAA